jgi:hypothetical protein
VSFLEQSLLPNVFWSAISAIGTLLAILVALFFPIYSQYRKNNHIEQVLKAEIEENLKTIKQINVENMTLSGGPSSGQEVSALQRNDALVTHIKLNMWSQLKYELATNRPKTFQKFNDINDSVELLYYSKTLADPMRLMIQNSAAEKFTSKYNNLFGK